MHTSASDINKISTKALMNMSIEDFTKYAEMVIQQIPKSNKTGISVKFPYTLNCSIKDKVIDCDRNTKYTAFINKTGLLCHVISPDDPDFLIRIRFRKSLKLLPKSKQLTLIEARVRDKIKIEVPMFH